MAGRVTLIATALAGLIAALATAPAGAAELRAGEAQLRDCAEALHGSQVRGVDRHSWRAPASGLLTVRLDGGPRGDWDLAVFRARRSAPAAASTSFASSESATLWVARGERVVAQGCRREGRRAAVPLSFELFRLSDAPTITEERASLESVAISGPDDLARLDALGLDVSHDVSPTEATVVAHSAGDRALLDAAGFASTTTIEDLAAADDADRAREARSAQRGVPSGLPSGRTSYREYADYTSDMKALTDNFPQIARPVTIGTTFENRPIEGIEIAGDVDATDDGRPVYINMGVHHAREWPSGELPMEFAIDLVEGYGTDTRITNLLDDVRVLVFPVINVDGFLASRSYGTSPADDNENATLAQAINDQNAYKRKNCRPTVPGSEALPCNMRSNSGVDLNRNYGAYWGGSGSSSGVSSQSYRGAGPYSEPESEAVHQLTSSIHPTVFITNHTYTDDGKWLRQPGFDDVIELTPDEAAMKDLGDDMEAANGWTSELGYETLGDITGATEDWNYFAQGTYGYTPEARGLNFHANYADSVIGEYVGEGPHAGLGVREAFLIAGERAGDEGEHSVIEGDAPADAVLRLRKEFQTPTSQAGLVVDDELDTTLEVPGSGAYRWDVNPSSRPLVPGEVWTMSCDLPASAPVETTVAVDRGEVKTVDFNASCVAGAPDPPGPTCRGQEATIVGSIADDAGELALLGTAGDDVIAALGGDDAIRGRGGEDLICAGGGDDELRGGIEADELRGQRGQDSLVGGPGPDALRGGRNRDTCRIDPEDTRRSCRPR